ncbi:unnamed protein product, partial [marine sediment metagenome]
GGKNYNLSFLSGNFSSLYMDFVINTSFCIHKDSPNASIASYEILPSQNLVLWNVTYNNSETYNSLKITNQSGLINLVNYTIKIFDFPAFDGFGSNSIDWNISSLINPNSQNSNEIMVKFNRTSNKQNQSILINNPIIGGRWVIQATQPNYIANLVVNSTEYFYNGNILEYNVSSYNEAISGNFSINIYNDSNDFIYESALRNHLGNLSKQWTVTDNGTGVYTLEVFWNDTNSDNQTLRIGYWNKTFEVWRKTSATLLSFPNILSAGDIAEFNVSYNSTEPSISGLSGATIECWENNSGTWNKWGEYWVGVYLINSLQDENNGNYTLKLETYGVPEEGNYNVTLVIFKEFYQPQNLTSWINVTGDPLNISITLGADWNEALGRNIIWTNNIPYVNDTINSIIQVKLVDNETEQLLEDGIIIAQLDSNVFYGLEVYSFTHNEEDKGLYNITIDTTGLDVSQDKTLFITSSAPGFTSSIINVTIFIDPIPTMITIQD